MASPSAIGRPPAAVTALPAVQEPQPVLPGEALETGTVEPELDMFDSFGTESETRIEPVLDSAAPKAADNLFPAALTEDFSSALFKSDIEHKIQALLDADLEADHKSVSMSDAIMDEIILAESLHEPDIFTPAHRFPAGSSEHELDLVPAETAEQARDDDEEDEDDENLDSFPESEPEPEPEDDMAQLLFVRQAKTRQRLKWILSIGTVVLALLLAGQAAYQFRDLIAVAFPGARDSLVTLCRLAQCQIKLPAQLDAISYEADELHTLPQDNTYEFSLLMRNHNAYAQAWPNIELTLKDSKKLIVVRRVFTPAEYLDNPKQVADGFQGNAEQAIKLYFVEDKTKASDYIVAIFYP